MLTYQDCLELTRKKSTKKIANNTWVVCNPDGSFSVKLHNTNIVKIYANGTYVLNTGGYFSKTTKQRLNEYCPVHISQKDFTWYVGQNKIAYYDGMKVTYAGEVLEYSQSEVV